MGFKPRLPKRRQIIQAARLIPDKGLELFLQIAERLPEYDFCLLARDAPKEGDYSGYVGGLLSRLPNNVKYVRATVSERSELLEESSVYLYTGVEPGIVLSVVEAMSAGCYPLSPPQVGAADIIKASGVGSTYASADNAVTRIRSFFEKYPSDEHFAKISMRAKMFSPEMFKNTIKALVNSPAEPTGAE